MNISVIITRIKVVQTVCLFVFLMSITIDIMTAQTKKCPEVLRSEFYVFIAELIYVSAS